ncbi:MAG: hypothetical protein GXY19_00185 [Phycisphaerae bacterium]|nr:hypothetical protein [Phycisphaerae bacterium]
MRVHIVTKVLTCVLVLTPRLALGADWTAEEVLRLYEQSLKPINSRVAFELESNTTFAGAWEPKGFRMAKTGMVYRDGNSLGFEFMRKTSVDGGQTFRSRARKFVLRENEPEAMVYDYPRENRETGRVNIFSNVDELRSTIHVDIGSSAVFDGHLSGCNNLTIPEVLREATSLRLRDAMESVDGHDTCVLEAATKYGKHSLWLDPDAGFNPRRITVQKEVGDLDGDRRLGTPPPRLPEGVESAVPRIAVVKVEMTVESIEIANISGVFVPVAAEISTREQYEDGQFMESTSVVKRSAIDFTPDFETLRAFVLDVPDGTPVAYQDARSRMGVKYEWFEGRPKAQVDQEFVDMMDANMESFHPDNKVTSASSDNTDADEETFAGNAGDLSTVTNDDSTGPVIAETGHTPVVLVFSCAVLVLSLSAWVLFRRKSRP